MSISLPNLYLDYDFDNSKATDKAVIDALAITRNGLAKEIVESFGSYMGDVNLQHKYTTTFEMPPGTEFPTTLPEKNNDDLIVGLLRFAHELGLDNCTGDGRWTAAVNQMATWYTQNIHTYSGAMLVDCPLINRKVRADCSGFTTACLWLYGALLDIAWPPASGAYTNDSNIGAKLQTAGFAKMQFASWDTVMAYDIICFDGHVEIYNGNIDGKHSSWAWGSCHDTASGGLPCHTAHVARGYDVIWRNLTNGTGGTGGSDVGQAAPLLSQGQRKANAMAIISQLMSTLGLSKPQAAGIAGVLMSEGGCNPAAFNKGEKAGIYKSSGANNLGAPYGQKHSPWDYGAGICQWTYVNRKEKAIAGGLGITREQAANIITNGGIEKLSLQQQVSMLIWELDKGAYKPTLAGIRQCNTASTAAATYYCHCVAGGPKGSAPATQAEIDAANARYSHVGASSQINKGMQYAEGLLL